ncbi:MAG: hypothetical protein HY870_24345 [Chloroflexi bacterium]|nr:hypothetical protein [Chloroflexota bacterium]
MSDDLERRLQIERDRIAQLETRQLPTMTAGEQTRLSWARAIRSRADLPQFYHAFIAELLAGRTLPYAVLTPTFPGFLRRETERLIFNLERDLYVLERRKPQLNCLRYALADIHYVEIGAILLHGWLKISGLADGKLSASTLRFNVVNDHLFTPFIEQIRPAARHLSASDLPAEQRKFDYLSTDNFKFMNYARRSLLPGERVIQPLLQPEIRATLITLLGRSWSRTVTTAHIHILTDSEWIIIRDDEQAPMGRGQVRYGGIWTYVPLDRITGVSLSTRPDDRLTLTLHFSHADHLDSVFASSNREAVAAFLRQLASVAPGVAVHGDVS